MHVLKRTCIGLENIFNFIIFISLIHLTQPCLKKTWLAPSLSESGCLSCTDALSMTQTGRLRLERRQGWQGAVMDECPCSRTLCEEFVKPKKRLLKSQ